MAGRINEEQPRNFNCEFVAREYVLCLVNNNRCRKLGRADVLGNSASFLVRNRGAANRIERFGLARVNVAKNCDDWFSYHAKSLAVLVPALAQWI